MDKTSFFPPLVIILSIFIWAIELYFSLFPCSGHIITPIISTVKRWVLIIWERMIFLFRRIPMELMWSQLQCRAGIQRFSLPILWPVNACSWIHSAVCCFSHISCCSYDYPFLSHVAHYITLILIFLFLNSQTWGIIYS